QPGQVYLVLLRFFLARACGSSSRDCHSSLPWLLGAERTFVQVYSLIPYRAIAEGSRGDEAPKRNSSKKSPIPPAPTLPASVFVTVAQPGEVQTGKSNDEHRPTHRGASAAPGRAVQLSRPREDSGFLPLLWRGAGSRVGGFTR